MGRLTRRAAIATATGLAASLAAPAWAAPARKPWPVAPGDMNLGDPGAPVRVVAYLSLTCSHCATFHTEVFPGFRARYIDTGRVYFTARELVTAPAQVAAAGFMMARCNGGARYFPILDQVFRSQSRWETEPVKDVLVGIARANGLTEAQFEACVTDETALAALEARIDYATGVDRVTSTPTFFVNGVLMPNARVPTLADLDAAIATALKPVARPSGGGR